LDRQLIATLVGGTLTLVGGFAATVFWRWNDLRREERKSKGQLAGAINIVIAELAANHVILERAIASNTGIGQLRVSDNAYSQVELLLAEQLEARAGQALFRAYAPIRAGDLYREWFRNYELSRIEIDLDECRRLAPVVETAAAELRRVRDALGPEYRGRDQVANLRSSSDPPGQPGS
jgi:hypothetical protein